MLLYDLNHLNEVKRIVQVVIFAACNMYIKAEYEEEKWCFNKADIQRTSVSVAIVHVRTTTHHFIFSICPDCFNPFKSLDPT